MTRPRSTQAGPAVAVVTGGASGIGLAMAHSYARDGARVLIADIDEPALHRARNELTAAGMAAEYAVVDLCDPASVARLGDAASQLGVLSAVCLNAGVTAAGTPLWETSAEVFDSLVAVNLRGLFHSIRTFVPILLEQGTPADIIVTASMAGMVAQPYSGAYGASKSGAVALAKALRGELATAAPYLRVAVLTPGLVKTNLMRTSAARLPMSSAMSADLVDNLHDGLNQLGVPPAEAAAWARQALADNRFWALPPRDDPFTGRLGAELDELVSVLRGT
jgi:NAD(P)-dependent dehydrogenase (short-subunit alcohol dehydrogenase family)